MPSSYIAFVNGIPDCRTLKSVGYTPAGIRVAPQDVPRLGAQGSPPGSLWVDAEVDGFHHILLGRPLRKMDKTWSKNMARFDEHNIFQEQGFLDRPDPARVQRFVNSVLNYCGSLQPKWISVPQLPMASDTSRNKANRALAKAAGAWRSETGFKSKFILPLIFTHARQLKGKMQWAPKLKWARKCYDAAGAEGLWVTDSSLGDQDGTGNFEKRFRALAELHHELRHQFPNAKVVAGPYWGMNLVLWARGDCDHPAISVGTAYRYYIPGGRLEKGKARIALPPLYRRALVSIELRTWLDDVLAKLSPADAAYGEFQSIRTHFSTFYDTTKASQQVARFYKDWLHKLEACLPDGRALALYQSFSSAFVLGRQLKLPLPKAQKTARRPERVAEHLMLNCL